MSRIFDEKRSKLSDRAQSCCWRSAGIICWRCRKKSEIIREETQDGKIGKSFISLKIQWWKWKKRVVNLQVVFVRVVYYFYFHLLRDVIKTTKPVKKKVNL